MGSIPVAKPSPLRTWHFSRRVIPLALLAAAAVATLAVALMVAWPSDDGSGLVDAGRVQDLSAEEPVYNDAGFFLVLLESGEVIALSDVDPHPFGEDPDCPITWRPGMVFEGTTGWLRATCSGSTFDRTGARVFGPAERGMDRFPVDVAGDGKIRVDTNTRLCAPDYTAAACP